MAVATPYRPAGSVARMAVRKRGSNKGELWHGYRRPILRDGAFWLAAVITFVALAAQNVFSGGHRDTTRWVLLGVAVAVTIVITFAVVGVLAGTVRGFGEGWRAAELPRPKPKAEPAPGPGATPAPDPRDEADRPVIGVEIEKRARALGRAIGATQRRARKG